jgi:hypothetical protein
VNAELVWDGVGGGGGVDPEPDAVAGRRAGPAVPVSVVGTGPSGTSVPAKPDSVDVVVAELIGIGPVVPACSAIGVIAGIESAADGVTTGIGPVTAGVCANIGSVTACGAAISAVSKMMSCGFVGRGAGSGMGGTISATASSIAGGGGVFAATGESSGTGPTYVFTSEPTGRSDTVSCTGTGFTYGSIVSARGGAGAGAGVVMGIVDATATSPVVVG